MAQHTNVLVQVHGMVTAMDPADPGPAYSAFRAALRSSEPALNALIPEQNCVEVNWGHAIPGTPSALLRDDQRLTEVQRRAANLTRYEALEASESDLNVISHNLFEKIGVPGIRQLIENVREKVFLMGLGDVAYYCAPDGEVRVRRVVYGQVLAALDALPASPEVRLHIIGHSLGVTIAHDFLFGLFNPPPYVPGFLAYASATPAEKAAFTAWRARAQAGTLTLGSFTATASQLPITLMRNQALIDQVFNGQLLDPGVVGVVGNQVRWQLFYERDDILGFPSRSLYHPASAIREVQVSTAFLPPETHTAYWTDADVIQRTAELIATNAA
jgi:hypothetical protein